MQAKSNVRLLKTIALVASCCFGSSLFAQVAWTADPFSPQVFVENNGQFDGRNGDRSRVVYGASCNGVDIYFTKKGFTCRHDAVVREGDEEEKPGEHAERTISEYSKEEKREKRVELIPSFLTIEWLGANPDVKVVSQDEVSWYYTYGPEENEGKTTVAHAFRKIIYKDLYPGIDVEYVFPADSSGMKYSLILHPGADPSAVKMKYTHAETLSLDARGDLLVKSAFGKFVDHAPVTFYSGTHEVINSSFTLHDNIVTFNIGMHDASRELVIDPWTTIPTFTGFNAGYDVNYDLAGNVYVFGSFSPFQLIKLDNSGTIQWIFNAAGINGVYYGDFAVDEVSGACYLAEGWSFGGARVLKVNALGVQTGMLPANVNLNEMWRTEYNRCIGDIVIAAGGTSANFQAFTLDTNLTALTPVNVLAAPNPFHDMVLFAIDNTNSFCYMATATSTFAPAAFDNVMVKCPVPGLLPAAFMVPDGHKFMEQGSTAYINGGGFGAGNGNNGMAASPAWLYTYDSDSLKRWDKNTGAPVAAIDVFPGPPIVSGTAIQVLWSGLSVDECDNIYVGMGAAVLQYDASLSLVTSYAMPDTVHDVKLGMNGKLYACGKGFVSEIQVAPNNTTVSVVQLSPACNLCDGAATVNGLSSSCAGNPAGFTYSWSTVPVQTTQTATGLCPGTYTVTLTTNCHTVFTGTVLITSAAGPAVNLGSDTTVCGTPNIVLDAGSTGTYSWSTGDTTQTITVTAPGIYWVTVTDSGCSSSDTIVVQGLAAPALGSDTTLCAGQDLSLDAGPGSSYLWSTGATTQTISPAASGQYWVNVYFGSCVLSDTVDVTFIPYPVPNLPADTTLCPGNSLVLDAGPAASYLWSTGATTQTISVNAPGAYAIQVSNGPCQATDTTLVAVAPPVVLERNVTLCNSASYVLDAGIAGVLYSWSTGATTQSITITESGTYWVTVNADGCILTDTTNVSGELAGGALYVPNTFTPDENGLNDYFTGYGTGITYFRMQIFNRWGELIFETEDQSQGWDGTYKSKLVQEDIYVWKITYRTSCTQEETIYRIGHVGVIR